jgi:hypothetical protein
MNSRDCYAANCSEPEPRISNRYNIVLGVLGHEGGKRDGYLVRLAGGRQSTATLPGYGLPIYDALRWTVNQYE